MNEPARPSFYIPSRDITMRSARMTRTHARTHARIITQHPMRFTCTTTTSSESNVCALSLLTISSPSPLLASPSPSPHLTSSHLTSPHLISPLISCFTYCKECLMSETQQGIITLCIPFPVPSSLLSPLLPSSPLLTLICSCQGGWPTRCNCKIKR